MSAIDERGLEGESDISPVQCVFFVCALPSGGSCPMNEEQPPICINPFEATTGQPRNSLLLLSSLEASPCSKYARGRPYRGETLPTLPTCRLQNHPPSSHSAQSPRLPPPSESVFFWERRTLLQSGPRPAWLRSRINPIARCPSHPSSNSTTLLPSKKDPTARHGWSNLPTLNPTC